MTLYFEKEQSSIRGKYSGLGRYGKMAFVCPSNWFSGRRAYCTFEMLVTPMIISKWSYNLKVVHYDKRCMRNKFHAYYSSLVVFLKKEKSMKDKRVLCSLPLTVWNCEF